MLKKKTGLLISSAGVVIFLTYLAVSSPKGIAVSANGDIKGVLNIVRAELQGESFWRKQLQATQDQLTWLEGQPQRVARRHAKLAELDAKFYARLQDSYAKYPNLRPSPPKQRAEELREEADRIEQEELDEQLEQYRLKRIKELQRLIPLLSANL